MSVYEGSEPIGLAPDGHTIIDGSGRAVGDLTPPPANLKNSLLTPPVKQESFPPAASPTSVGVTSQRFQASLLAVSPDDGGYEGLILFLLSAASGTLPTSFYVALYDVDGGRLAVSADEKANIVDTVGYLRVPFTAPYLPTVEALAYGGYVQNGAYGDFDASFGEAQNLADNDYGDVSPAQGVSVPAVVGAPPNPIIFTPSIDWIYVGLY